MALVIRIELAAPDGVRWAPEQSVGDGVLVVAGSSGRIDEDRARVFAMHGCCAESIRWFGGPGQHAGPWEIPLEVFLERVDALKADCDRVWVVGTSFGAEAALLCGALSDRVDGVIAFAPSDVVWAGYDERGRETSHWTLGGKPLPYVPLDWEEYEEETPPRFRAVYERSRRTFPGDAAAAAIPVERIGRLLLVAGGDDHVWPSTAHAERIRIRRAAAGLATPIVTALDAGHRAILPGEPRVAGGAAISRGGTEAADRRLGERAWAAIVSQLDSARHRDSGTCL